MASCRTHLYGSPPQLEDPRINELEERVAKLEEMLTKVLTRGGSPSFMDFKFIKEDEEEERLRREDNRRTMAAMRNMFNPSR
jgi:hypothetical protein